MKLLWIVLLQMCSNFVAGQETTIYYSNVKVPADYHDEYFAGFQPELLADDLAWLLCCATGKKYKTAPFSGETKGIFLLIDTNLRDSTNETGHVMVKDDAITISAANAAGISYAVYSWLRELGFRFYLPGNTWTHIPDLKSEFQAFSKTYSPHFKLRMFNASGGSFPVPGLDENGLVKREWNLWYRRNRMGSDYLRIDGHKGELFNIVHKKEIEADPAILAPHNGSRKYAVDAKLDPTYKKGVEMFTDWLVGEFERSVRTTPTYLPFKKYQSADMGDGLNYCHTEGCEKMFRSVSDQSFYLTNEAANKLRQAHPQAGASTLAYTERADTPSMKIASNVHVMVVPGAFQQTTIPSDLMQRWVKKHPVISQYDFLNIGVWNYDHPFFNLTNYHAYLQWIKELDLEGMCLETSLSAMASGLQQYFILTYLAQPFDEPEKEMDRFYELMFGKARAPVKRIFKEWYFSDAHLKTSLEKPAFFPDEIARFIKQIRQAEQTRGLSQIERERILSLKAYIVYLCAFYDLHNEQPVNNKSLTSLKAESLLRYTWGLYQKKIFHNTQLNDLLKKSTDNPSAWDFRKGKLIRSISPLSAEEIEKVFAGYESKYGADFAEEIEFTVTDMRYLAKNSADSIRIKTIDEKAFGNFSYGIKIYAPKAGNIRIRYATGISGSEKPVNSQRTLMALESGGGKLLAIHRGIRENELRMVEFSIPSEGLYVLQLAQYQATPVEWIIFPGDNLLFVEKKQVVHHGIQLTEPKGSKYSNTQLAVWNDKRPFSFQPMFGNVKNTVSFLSAEGRPIKFSHNAVKNSYLVDARDNSLPYSFYINEVFRWPVVLKEIPPYFFFLKKETEK